MNDILPDNILSPSSTGIAVAPGKYQGVINSQYMDDALLAALSDLPALLEEESAVLVAGGRNQNLQIDLPYKDSNLTVLVKVFGRQSRAKDWVDLRYRGSKAQRSYEAALHLHKHDVATPAPVVYLQHRKGWRLEESYFITIFENNTVGFNEVLIELLNSNPTASRLMPLLMEIAELCRGMHDAGYVHHDLGNQNILLNQSGAASWQRPLLIDLNRGRLHKELSLKQRGQDLSRLNIPSGLMEFFLDMYWGSKAPRDLVDWHRRYQARFQLRARSRKWRHPFREARIARENKLVPAHKKFPHPKDIWIWDDFSDQALSALDRRERKKRYPGNRKIRMVLDTLGSGYGLWHKHRSIKSTVFNERVAMKNRLGLALEPDETTLDSELKLLEQLGKIPLIVRICHHEPEQRIAFQVALIKRLADQGHEVSLALVQDRDAVLQSDRWCKFVRDILGRVASYIVSVEFGHAINRVKWGVWDFNELREFYKPLQDIRSRYPHLAITGPATIDFEYSFLLSALKTWPRNVPLAAISHHLYVDRRGAPENPQGVFNTIDKCVLASAIAERAEIPGSKVIISEVNWPVAGTSKYSPVTSPFEYREPPVEPQDESGVDEETYAQYMIRYLLLSLCSGVVEKVYWWRLVARGYGLVDLSENKELRLRPGFRALRHFLRVLGDAAFIKAEMPPQAGDRQGVYRFWFESSSDAEPETIGLCWSHGVTAGLPGEWSYHSVEDLYGNKLKDLPKNLSGSPVYLRGCNKIPS